VNQPLLPQHDPRQPRWMPRPSDQDGKEKPVGLINNAAFTCRARQLEWPQVETAPGVYDWFESNSTVNTARAAGAPDLGFIIGGSRIVRRSALSTAVMTAWWHWAKPADTEHDDCGREVAREEQHATT
jgi:hypothetical protein